MGAAFCHCNGLLTIKSSVYTAAARPCGGLAYFPPFQSGSLRMESMIILRIIRFRPAIWTGRLARGMSASMKSGYVSPHSHVCMPPMEVPITRRR